MRIRYSINIEYLNKNAYYFSNLDFYDKKLYFKYLRCFKKKLLKRNKKYPKDKYSILGIAHLFNDNGIFLKKVVLDKVGGIIKDDK